MWIKSGELTNKLTFVAVDATDLKTRETGLASFTVYRSRNGSAPVAFTTPTVAELSAANMPGVYTLLLDEDMTIGAGLDSEECTVHITATGMAPVTRTYELVRDPAEILLDRAAGVETNLTVRGWFRLAAAVMFSKSSGMGTATNTFRDFNDTKNRIVATTDADGGHTAFGTRDVT